MPAACSSHAEYLLRPAPLDIFLSKEAGIVATQNFFGFVTLDSFGAGIPTDNLSSRIQHENRVVLDSVEKRPIFFFAVPELFLCKPASSAVALGAPTCGSSDQRAQDGSEDQNSLGLA